MTSRKNSTEKGHIDDVELDPIKRKDKNGDVTTIEFVDTESGSSSEYVKRDPRNRLATARDLVTEILSVEDDPTLVRDPV